MESFKRNLQTEGIGPESALKAGVLKRKPSREIEDYFKNRLIFPTIKKGMVLHLSGRSLDESNPKYLHQPGKIEHLYNEDALSEKKILLVEGAPDCIAASQVGYSAAGLLGSQGFKKEYLPKFSRCETVFVCFDGDRAGREGALKTAMILGDKARIVALPSGMDLNEYLKEHSKEDFDALLSESKDLIQSHLDQIPAETDSVSLSKELHPIIEMLAVMEDSKSEAYLSSEIKPRFGLSEKETNAYRKDISQLKRSNQKETVAQADHKETIRSADFESLVDLVEDDGKASFLILNEAGEITVVKEYEEDEKLLLPPSKDKIPWKLPAVSEILELHKLEKELSVQEADHALYQEIRSHLQGVSDLPFEEHYDLLTAWVMHTYLLEGVQYTPIICLFAVPERGKSRTGKALTYLSYRGLHVESLREAYIFRFADYCNASIFFDVVDIWKKAEKKDSQDILLHRYERGATVPRVNDPDKGPFEDTTFYKVFGPTVIAVNESPQKILGTRAVTINMQPSSKLFENPVTPEAALPLKSRLLLFRARHLGKDLPEFTKPVRGRLGDILKPICQIIQLACPERLPAFGELIKRIQKDRQLESSETLEAEVLRAVVQLEYQVEKGVLPVKDVTEEINRGKSDQRQFTPHRIGRVLGSLGFGKKKCSNGASAIVYNDQLIKQLKPQYGLEETSETPERSETSLIEKRVESFPYGVSEDTEVSDVYHRVS